MLLKERKEKRAEEGKNPRNSWVVFALTKPGV
jgi:hypothetical protein